MPRTTVVVPCFEEAARLARQRILDFARESDDVTLLFVDDGSRDATRAVLEELCAASPQRLRLHALPRNVGKGEAVRQGVLRACAEGAELVGYWDADLSTPLDAIAELAALLEARPEVLVVLGARVQLLGRTIERRAWRHYAGRVFATAASNVLRLRVYDTQCGAKLLRRTPEVEALFAEPFLTRWFFDVELLARLMQGLRGLPGPGVAERVVEHPLREWRHVPGSKLRMRDFARAALDLWRIRRHYAL